MEFPRWWEERETGKKITQHCAIFRNRKNVKRRAEPTKIGRKPGLKGTGGGRFKPLCQITMMKRCVNDDDGDITDNDGEIGIGRLMALVQEKACILSSLFTKENSAKKIFLFSFPGAHSLNQAPLSLQ